MLDFPVSYGNQQLNTVEGVGGGKRRGCMLEEFNYARSQGVGYTEKRSQDDGLDASDVYMGPRYINLAGVVYGESPADTYDRMQDVRTALTPTIAYALDTPEYGYMPLQFEMPTNSADFPGGTKALEFRARPLGQPEFSIRRDGGSEPGANPSAGGAILWRASLECKDPRMYVRPFIALAWTGAVTAAPIRNRGDYPAPLDILIVLATASAATDKVEIDIGQSNMTIALGHPPSGTYAAGTVFRYSGAYKVLTVQVPLAVTDVLAMDLLSFRNNTTYPTVPPGDSTYTIRTTPAGKAFATGTRLMYSESFA